MSPWLSVVMPTYNGAAYVGAAVSSVAREARGQVELICVDDGSTDDTRDIVRRHRGNLEVVELESGGRRGWMAATNLGIEVATGRWVAMLHQDDWWLPGRLEAVWRAIQDSPQAGLVVGPSVFVDDAGKALGRWRLPWKGAPPARAEVARRLYVQNWLAVPSVTLRADVLAAVGGLDPALWYTADWDLWLRMLQHADLASTAQALSAFRVHAESQTVLGSRDTRGFEQQIRVVQERHVWAAAGDGSVLAAGRMATTVNTALARGFHGSGVPIGRLVGDAVGMTPRAWRRFVRDSRIVDRAVPRARLALRRRGAPDRRK